MTLPVRIEGKAWTDPRYQALAIELGLGRARYALIAVAEIWRWQTENYTEDAPTYCVPRAVIVGALDSKTGPESMVEAGLAEAMADGTFRVRGGRNDKGESRIDWYWRDQQQRRAAGAASADRRKKAGDPRTSDGRLAPLSTAANGRPTGHQRATNGRPTGDQRATERPPSSPDSDLRTPDLSISGGAREVPPPVAADPSMRELLDHALDRLNQARAAVDPAAPPLPLVQGQPGNDLLDHLRPLPAERRRPALDLAIDVMVAELRREGAPVNDYRLGMLAGGRSWHRWSAGTVAGAQARGSRPAARGDPSSGAAPPAATHGTGTIDPKTVRPRKP